MADPLLTHAATPPPHVRQKSDTHVHICICTCMCVRKTNCQPICLPALLCPTPYLSAGQPSSPLTNCFAGQPVACQPWPAQLFPKTAEPRALILPWPVRMPSLTVTLLPNCLSVVAFSCHACSCQIASLPDPAVPGQNARDRGPWDRRPGQRRKA